MISRDIEHDADVAIIESQTGADNSAASRFEHSDIDGRIFEDQLRGNGTRIVALNNLLILNIRSIGRRKTNCAAAAFQNMSDQSRGRRFAIGAGYRDYRNSCRRARRKEHIDHLLGNIAADAFARGEMHTKAGSGVYLDYSPAIFTKRFTNIWSDDIHTRYIEADDSSNALKKK